MRSSYFYPLKKVKVDQISIAMLYLHHYKLKQNPPLEQVENWQIFPTFPEFPPPQSPKLTLSLTHPPLTNFFL